MKKIFTTALLAIASLTTHAQRDARVQLQLGNWSSPNNTRGLADFGEPANLTGMTAEHRIYKNLYIKAGFQRWTNFYNFSLSARYFDTKGDPLYTYPSSIGSLGYRKNYSMVDVIGIYRLSLGKHELYGGAGISNAFGIDYTLKVIHGAEYADEPGFCLLLEYEYNEIKAHHVGAAWEAGYNYNFAHQRLNIGTSISGQHYAADFNLYTIKLNLGYNFNIVMRK